MVCVSRSKRPYVVQRDVFGPSEVRELRRAFERLERIAYRLRETCMHRGSLFVLNPIDDDRMPVSIQRIVWCGAAEPKLSEIGSDPRLLSMASQLLGSKPMNQLINQAHFKIPGDGVEFPWHQDSRMTGMIGCSPGFNSNPSSVKPVRK